MVNTSPFEWSENKINALVSALESSLHKTKIMRDFYGVYQHDGGNGQAFSVAMGYTYDEIDIEFFLSEVDGYIENKIK
ncbi:MAG: hypothetical protein ACTSO8_06670 [Promethearchaeota archaeon]